MTVTVPDSEYFLSFQKNLFVKSKERKNSKKLLVSPSNENRRNRSDSSSGNSQSNSPIVLSRSTSPAASIANFIRPISAPYIQVKEPLSPKIFRNSSSNHPASSFVANDNDLSSTGHSENNVLFDESSSTEHHRSDAAAISSVPETCFEPENYRNLSTLNSNQQKKLSFSDPTLNQTTKITRRCQETQEDISILSLRQGQTIKPDDDDDDNEQIRSDDDETQSSSSTDETFVKKTAPITRRTLRKVRL